MGMIAATFLQCLIAVSVLMIFIAGTSGTGLGGRTGVSAGLGTADPASVAHPNGRKGA